MRTIRVGREKQKPFGVENAPNVQLPSETMSEEQKQKFLESISQMPKDKWVGALRSAGFESEANECERELAEEHLRELELESRKKRLDEIMSMDDDDKLSLLIAEGFDDEAKMLSEAMAAEIADAETPSPAENVETESFGAEMTDEGIGEENEPIAAVADGEDNVLSVVDDEKKYKKPTVKRVGRKKNAKK